jgi:hypothetical protein
MCSVVLWFVVFVVNCFSDLVVLNVFSCFVFVLVVLSTCILFETVRSLYC